MTKTKKEDAAKAVELKTSEVQPAVFVLKDGNVLTAEELAAQAFKKSGYKSPSSWNAAAADKREVHIQAVVDTLDLQGVGMITVKKDAPEYGVQQKARHDKACRDARALLKKKAVA